MSDSIEGYEIKFTCYRCKQMFVAYASVKQSENTFVSGLLCYDCGNQETLFSELDFSV